jgi:acyl-CoA synthetase (NDP forming)
MLRPKSIVAIGGIWAANVVEQCKLMGFSGDIWPVHPSKEEIHGVRAYRSIEELPGSPDAAFIGVNRELTIDAVQALSTRDCGGAVCFASGWRESDTTGRELEARLLDAAGDMPVLGPNCYGYINYVDGALLWPDQQGGRRLGDGETGPAIIAQSSNIAINFTMQKRGLPLSYVFTVGNQAQVGISELALNLLDDPRVDTLGIYLEGFDSVEGFEALARKSRALNKPVVIYSVGKSEKAQASALSHTASLVGSHAVTSDFLRRNGFGQADSIPVFLETLKLLHVYGPLDGYRLSSMSCSGGEASIMADAAHGRRVYFPDLDDRQKAPLQQALGPRVAIANPLDYQTYCWGDRQTMQAAYSAMAAIGFDLNMLVIDFPHPTRCSDADWHIAVDAFEAALGHNAAKGALVVGMPENVSEEDTEDFRARGMVAFYGIEEAIRASEIAADIGAAWKRDQAEPVVRPVAASATRVNPDEAEAKQLLAAAGVPIPRGARIESVDQALEQAIEIGYTVVLKALGIAHKTERNAVRIGLESKSEVVAAARELFQLSDSLYLEAMAPSVAELLVGVTRDAQFGLVLTVGSGGILVEMLRDARTLLMPARREDVAGALADLRSATLLAGFRGRPAGDIEAAIDAIMAIQEFALQQANRLVELDVNPLLVGPAGQGAVAADALIVLEE